MSEYVRFLKHGLYCDIYHEYGMVGLYYMIMEVIRLGKGFVRKIFSVTTGLALTGVMSVSYVDAAIGATSTKWWGGINEQRRNSVCK